MPVSFSTRRLSHRFLLAKTDTCLFLLSLFSFFFSFFLFLLLSIFSLLLLLFYFLKWILSMPSYYLLSVPLLILFHYSLNTEGRRKRRKADLMNLSSWNLQCHLTTLLGMVKQPLLSYICWQLFMMNCYTLQSSVFQRVFTFLPCFPIFPVAFPYFCKGGNVLDSYELCYWSPSQPRKFCTAWTLCRIQLSFTALLTHSAAAVTCLQWPLALPGGITGEFSCMTLPDPYGIAWHRVFGPISRYDEGISKAGWWDRLHDQSHTAENGFVTQFRQLQFVSKLHIHFQLHPKGHALL